MLRKKHTRNGWKNLTDYKQQEIDTCIQKELNPVTDQLTMGEVINLLNELTGGNAIIVTDVGQHQMVTCRYAKFNQSKSNITSGGLGTMGFALPAAIGAKVGAPERTVVAIIGDGGFQMTLQELGTIMQSNIDVKIIILNNEFLGMVRQWQELFHERRYSFTDIQSPDFVALAKAYNIDGQKVSERENLKERTHRNDATRRCLFTGSYGRQGTQCFSDGTARLQCE